jgi:formate/nitrite transporter FocA (FNT family)
MPTHENGADERPQKSYRDILRHEILAGLTELNRPASGLFLSSLSAGLDIGFSVLLMATMLSVLGGVVPDSVVRLLVANMYAVGFILVILGRSELFTEHTALAVLPVLARRSPLIDMLRVWGIVFVGTVIGAFVFAFIIAHVVVGLGTVQPSALEHIALEAIEHDAWVILLSAVLAGWLMGELAWLLAAGRDTTSQVLFVWIVTFSIGFAGLHHCIVGTVEVMAAVFAGDRVTFVDYLRFIGLTTVGNALGGTIFVAIIKFGHVVRSQDEEPEERKPWS